MGELFQTFQMMLRQIFIQIPQELATTAAVEEILKEYASRQILSREKFYERFQPSISTFHFNQWVFLLKTNLHSLFLNRNKSFYFLIPQRFSLKTLFLMILLFHLLMEKTELEGMKPNCFLRICVAQVSLKRMCSEVLPEFFEPQGKKVDSFRHVYGYTDLLVL